MTEDIKAGLIDILRAAGPNGYTCKELEESFGFNYFTANKYLNMLVADGIVQRSIVPRNGSKVYYLPEQSITPHVRQLTNDKSKPLYDYVMIAANPERNPLRGTPLASAGRQFLSVACLIYSRAGGNNEGAYSSPQDIKDQRRGLQEVIKQCQTMIANCNTLLNDDRLWDNRVVQLTEDPDLPKNFFPNTEAIQQLARKGFDVITKESKN